MTETFSPRKLLLPLVPLYRLALLLRELRLGSRLEPVKRLRWPVVSIGNLSTGGAGKTPLTIALAKALERRGFYVDVLSRGYGRQSRNPARVRPDGTAEEFGDEPLLIAREAGVPVYVAPQRFEACSLAEADSPLAGQDGQPIAVHLLDDGFQHRQLGRDVDILLLNGRDWQDSLLPAGNLREPLRAIHRAGVIAIPADEAELETELRTWGWKGPVWRLRRSMEVPAVDGPVAAFCGIAHPGQFFDGLEAAGLRLAARIAFPDHHRYSAADLDRLTAAARAAGATVLITTEKDLVRLGKLAAAFPESLALKAARLHVEINNESAAMDWLAGRLAPRPADPPL
ncbi:MAG: tetraacyldisaccharide 4'-kinase [Terracidiphilus sp.]|jgi:tetraacyldisaccharide 4'-kinase